jgi:16S rRNA (cytidine1402-2'-O)-methyltransferase
MLYLVATPIGNLGDITFRAVEVLKQVDIIACEDTRKTGILLKHYEIKKPLISFHEYNENKVRNRIISILRDNKDVALVSDAGTPVISDPGYTLVRDAIKEDIDITTIPGATAFVNAVILSGLATHSFVFRGFPPHKQGRRRNFIKADKELEYTLVYYESPYRIVKFIRDALEVLGDRRCAVANDLTKLYETIIRGTLSEVLEQIENSKIKGEYVAVIEGFDRKSENKKSKKEKEQN